MFFPGFPSGLDVVFFSLQFHFCLILVIVFFGCLRLSSLLVIFAASAWCFHVPLLIPFAFSLGRLGIDRETRQFHAAGHLIAPNGIPWTTQLHQLHRPFVQ